MLFIVIQVTIVVIIILLFLVLSMVWPPDSPWAPWWRTNKDVAKAACKIADVGKKDTVFELGCGDAEVLLTAGNLGAQGVGIEIDPARFLVASIRTKINRKSQRITIKRENFFESNFSSATVIFVYLVPKTLNKLLPKFKKELRKGTRVVSYRYEMNLKMKKYDKKNNLRLYVI